MHEYPGGCRILCNWAVRELRARKAPNYDAACFHAQQMAEEYLKAILQEQDAYFPKTHDSTQLLSLCVSVEPSLASQAAFLGPLARYAMEYRYPGLTATRPAALEACRAASRLRDVAREKLGMPS